MFLIFLNFHYKPACNILEFHNQFYISAPDDPHAGEKARQRWERAASHPDEADLEAVTEFVAQMKRKLAMLQKYLEKGAH